MLARPSALVRQVIGCAIEVHRALGPGLLESAYAICLAYEFATAGLKFERQVPIPVLYKGQPLDCAYRADLIVEGILLVELKSVETIIPIHHAQVLTYMKLLNLKQGLIINFNVDRLVNGVKNFLL